jgi:hypothetical protein
LGSQHTGCRIEVNHSSIVRTEKNECSGDVSHPPLSREFLKQQYSQSPGGYPASGRLKKKKMIMPPTDGGNPYRAESAPLNKKKKMPKATPLLTPYGTQDISTRYKYK